MATLDATTEKVMLVVSTQKNPNPQEGDVLVTLKDPMVGLYVTAQPGPYEDLQPDAQVIVKRGRKILQKQPDVPPWEEYWAFGRDGDRWKLKEIFPDEQGNALWDQENFDEDTTPQMLDWYYSKSRAI